MTSQLFGMAGLAEAAFASYVGWAWILMFGLVVASLAGLATRTRGLCVAAILGFVVFSLVFQPWEGFSQPLDSHDSDARHWFAEVRRVAWLWAATAAVVAASFAGTFVRRWRVVRLEPLRVVDPTPAGPGALANE